MASVPKLYVEGRNDQFVIANLLKAHGIELSPEGLDPTRPIIEPSKTSGGQIADVSYLVKTLDSKIKVSEKPVGFVFDADPDVGMAARWQSVRARLSKVAVASPAKIPVGGFVGESTEYKVRVGVWLMPDNQRDGKLETFLRDLINEKDSLIEIAIQAAAKAAEVEQRYRDVDRPKAELFTWLAWQAVPGLPYGTAVASNYFQTDTQLALAFVEWFRGLYGI